MLTYEPMCGSHIHNACREACKMATEQGEDVTFTFNQIEVVVKPNSDWDAAYNDWENKREAAQKAYLASPEYAKAQKEAKERETRNIARYTELTEEVLKFKNAAMSKEETKLLSEWCLLADYNYIPLARNKEVANHLLSLGYVRIKEVPQDVRDEANKDNGSRKAKLDCVIGNIVDMILCGPTGTPHHIASHFLDQLSE